MTQCWVCGNDNPEGEAFCGTCGARIEVESAQAPPEPAPAGTDDAGATGPAEADDSDAPAATEDADASADAEASSEEPALAVAGDDDSEAEEPAAAPEEGAPAAEPTPKAGYIVFPDSTEQPIPPSQWLIGRADLARYVEDPEKANEISRGHMTVFQEGEKFFIEDGKTMVQEKPSSNKTWLVRGGSRILVTGTGRNELQDADEIDVAELVKLQFVEK